ARPAGAGECEPLGTPTSGASRLYDEARMAAAAGEVAYLVVTGSRAAYRAPDLVRGLLAQVPRVLTLLTPNAARVIAARDLSWWPRLSGDARRSSWPCRSMSRCCGIHKHPYRSSGCGRGMSR